MSKIYVTDSVEETLLVGEKLATEIVFRNLELNQRKLKLPVTIVKLVGDLGTGKTHFTKGLANALGIKKTIKSPSYTYMSEYDYSVGYGKKQLIHVDAWRVDTPEIWDLLEMENYLEPGNIVAVEWPRNFNITAGDNTDMVIYNIVIAVGKEDNQRIIEVSKLN